MRTAQDYLEYHRRFGIDTLPMEDFSLDQNPEALNGVRLVVGDVIRQSKYNTQYLLNQSDAMIYAWVKRYKLWKLVRVFYGSSSRKAIEHAAGEPYTPDFQLMYQFYVATMQRMPQGFWQILRYADIIAILRHIFFDIEGITPSQLYSMRKKTEFREIVRQHQLNGMLDARFQNNVFSMVQAVIPFSEWTSEMLFEHYDQKKWPKNFWSSANPAAKEQAIMLLKYWIHNCPSSILERDGVVYAAVDERVLSNAGLTGALVVYGMSVQRLLESAYPDKQVIVVDTKHAEFFTMTKDDLRQIWKEVRIGGRRQLPSGLVSVKNPRREELVSNLILYTVQEELGITGQELLGKSNGEVRDILSDLGMRRIVNEVPADELRRWIEFATTGARVETVEKLKQDILVAWEQIQRMERHMFPYGILVRNPEHSRTLAQFMAQRFLRQDLKADPEKLSGLSPWGFKRYLQKHRLGLLLTVASQEDIIRWLQEQQN